MMRAMSSASIQKLKFFSSVSALYVGTLLFFALAFYPSFFQDSNKVIAQEKTIEVTQENAGTEPLILGKPNRIIIERIGIDLPVIDGHYNPNDKSWTLSDTNAQFAVLSSPANNVRGNTFIYGHNIKGIFDKLHGIGERDIAKVYTDNGYVFEYMHHYTEIVPPTHTEIFSTYEFPTLTLQTCTGPWNEVRQMSYFIYAGVKKI